MYCFLENDPDMPFAYRLQIEYITQKPISNYFDVIITEAHKRKDDVIKAIRECNIIWIATTFEGVSSTLLDEMLGIAFSLRLNNKLVINVERKERVQLLTYQLLKMEYLTTKYNILFRYLSDYQRDTIPQKELPVKTFGL